MHSKLVVARVGLLSLCLGCGSETASPTPPAEWPLALPVLGQGVARERYTAEVAAAGTWAYSTTWGYRVGDTVGSPAHAGNAVKVWDVAGRTPILRDSIIVTDAFTLGDAQISDDGRLLVVPTEGSVGSIVIFDLSDPARPTQLARFFSPKMPTESHTATLGRVAGRLYAFLAAVPHLVIADLSDPAHPIEVFGDSLGTSWVHDMFVRDGLLFACQWDSGLTVWDIGGGAHGGSPANPVRLGGIVTKGGAVHNVLWFHDSVTSSKRYAFVGEEGFGSVGDFSSGDIHVVDVSNLAKPREVAFFHVNGAGPHNFTVDEQNGFLYAAYYNAGVRVLDIRGELGTCSASERAPDGRCDLGLMGREAARGLDTGDPVFVWGVERVGTALYASDMLSGLFKLDVSALTRSP
ncbi:MAG TPA: hypothetical protein VKD28_01770 [Gemmatimonadales bacterium]|nr:hypothetical protein [Gemmatimonadales bacterium]